MNIKKIGLLFAILLNVCNVEGLLAQDLDSVEGDRKALVDLYNGTGGDNWSNNSGWLKGNPSNDWYGIEVDGNGRVVKVKLNGTGFGQNGARGGNNLRGHLPESIGNLQKVTYFNVKHNFIEGQIPSSIGNMRSLVRLHLNGNEVEPTATNSVNVNKYSRPSRNMRTNRFTGQIPSTIGKLKNLEFLEINGIGLRADKVDDGTGHPGLEGGIPEEIGDLTKLKGVYLNFNSIDHLPSSMQNLTQLRSLYIGRNALAGTGMPSWFSALVSMRNLDFEANQVGGVVADLSGWKDFQFFWGAKNSFIGDLPGYLLDGTHPDINMLELAWNNFSGTMPEIHTPNNLNAITLEGNDISGEIPASWGINTPKLTNFGIGWNNLEGEFPDMSGAYKLRYIRARNNNFTGPLPALNTDNSKLSRLWFQNNNFSGQVDPSIVEAVKNGRDPFFEVNISNNRFCQEDLDEFVSAINNLTKVEKFSYGSQQDPVCGDGGSGDSDNEASIGIPELYTPGNGMSNASLNPTFDWSSTEGAESYTIRVNKLNQSSPVIDKTVFATSYNLSGSTLEPDATYEWKVRAVNGSAIGEWSNLWQFTTEQVEEEIVQLPAPNRVSPANNGLVNSTPTFEWSAVEGADYYVLHSNSVDPAEMVIVEDVTGTTFTPGVPLDPGTVFHWRVHAVSDSVAGEWSEVWEFQTKEEATELTVPTIYAPANQDIDVPLTPTFEWSGVGADYYELHISAAGESIDVMVDGTTFTLTDSLDPGISYEWRVRGVTQNAVGEWSELWQFETITSSEDGDGSEEVAILPAPDQITPANEGLKNHTPTFEWSAVEGADYYVLHSNSVDPAEMVIVENVSGTTYTPSDPLEPGKVYHWRVQAVADTVEGEWSEIWEFTTESDKSVTMSSGPDGIPLQTGLAQNYPNPFNPSTQIEYTLSELQGVSLKVYDMAGRQIAVLVDGVKRAGRHTATFSANDLASGIYFYRFITDSQIYTKKMTLVK